MGKFNKLIKRAGVAMASSAVMALPAMTLAVDAGLGELGVEGLGSGTLLPIIGAFINTVLVLLGVILVIIILYAGWIWMSSQGDPGKIKKAKDMIFNAIIGLAIIFAAFAITNFVFEALTDVTSGTPYSAS